MRQARLIYNGVCWELRTPSGDDAASLADGDAVYRWQSRTGENWALLRTAAIARSFAAAAGIDIIS